MDATWSIAWDITWSSLHRTGTRSPEGCGSRQAPSTPPATLSAVTHQCWGSWGHWGRWHPGPGDTQCRTHPLAPFSPRSHTSRQPTPFLRKTKLLSGSRAAQAARHRTGSRERCCHGLHAPSAALHGARGHEPSAVGTTGGQAMDPQPAAGRDCPSLPAAHRGPSPSPNQNHPCAWRRAQHPPYQHPAWLRGTQQLSPGGPRAWRGEGGCEVPAVPGQPGPCRSFRQPHLCHRCPASPGASRPGGPPQTASPLAPSLGVLGLPPEEPAQGWESLLPASPGPREHPQTHGCSGGR